MESIHFHFSNLDSTNNWAKENSHLFEKDKLTLITADSQHAGRGRFNRKWISGCGVNLLASYCFFVHAAQKDIQTISQVIGVSTAKALEAAGVKVKLKWPNDLLVQDKKIAGILCETQAIDNLIFVVAGIGINVNVSEEFLQQVDQPATSVFALTGKIVSIEKITQLLTDQILIDLPQFIAQGFEPFYNDYKTRLGFK